MKNDEPRVKIGTVVTSGDLDVGRVSALMAEGFESFELAFVDDLGGIDLGGLAPRLRDVGVPVSCLGVYGNPLMVGGTLAALREAIRSVREFGSDLVSCFTGRVTGASIPDSVPRFREIFREVAREAADLGVRVAFENCPQGGTWESGDRNLAHNPAAWELLFDAVPAENLGLEWEPCHQMCQLIDPMPQLALWGGRIFHVHGKDAEVDGEVLARFGAYGAERFAHHRFPGRGTSDWGAIFRGLEEAGFRGSVDIEGAHDSGIAPEHEDTAQRDALEFLRRARG
ncbi:sugar phosphate isomerase/epimerase [soil metagenome]